MTNTKKAGAPRRLWGAAFAVTAIFMSAAGPVCSASNNPPVISGAPPQSIDEKAPYSFSPTARDPDGNTLRFWLENRPRWMRLDSKTGKLSGTPGYKDADVYPGIKLFVADGRGRKATLGPFAITVKNVNRPPRIFGYAPRKVPERERYSFTPKATDPDGDKLTFRITGKPRWATFSTTNGALTGTPGYEDAKTYSDIVISVSDGSASTSLAPFSITVRNTNRSPTIFGSPRTNVREKEVYAFMPKARDPDGDNLRFWLENRPRWLKIDRETGGLSGSPNFEDAGVYNDIKLYVGDGRGGKATLGPFAITVKDVNRPPRVSGFAPRHVPESERYSFTPKAFDPDGDEVTFSITGKPRWATFNEANGTLAGTPGYGPRRS